MALMNQFYLAKLIPGADNQQDLGDASTQFKNLYLTGLAYIDGFGEDTDMGDFDVHSLDGLYGYDDNVYIDMGADGRLIIAADGAGTPFSTPDIDITGTVFFDDYVGLDTDKRLEFRDTGLFIFSQADGYLNIVSDTATRLGDSTPTNYTQFDSTGHQTMVGTAKPWDDLRIEPVARTTGANAPTFEQWADDAGLGDTGTSRGIYLYSFDDAVGGSEKEIHFSMQLPHGWDIGSVEIHVHWIGAVADTTSAPRWGLEYAWREIGGTFGANATIIYTDGKNYTLVGDDADITAGKHYLSKFASISPGTTADSISSILVGRLFRDSANVADTYNAAGAKCGLLYIDAHYQLNSLGSTDEYTK